MTRKLEAVDTLPSIYPNGRGKAAKIAAASVGGTSIAAAVIYYLLTCVSAQADRLRIVEAQVNTIPPVLQELQAGQRETIKAVGEIQAKIGRIEGYISARREDR